MRPRKPDRQSMHATVAATPNATRTPRWVREYVREHMLPNIVQRLYEIGMGTTRFEQATMVGKVVKVPASPAVQVRALDSLKLLGVPQQLGLAALRLPADLGKPVVPLVPAQLEVGQADVVLQAGERDRSGAVAGDRRYRRHGNTVQ